MPTRDRLINQLQALSVDDFKATLSEAIRRKRTKKARVRLRSKNADVLLLDRDAALLRRHLDVERLENLIGATGWIYDWSVDDQRQPRIRIKYGDGTEQWIDILASVKDNAASIGHPMILHAIRRWEHIIRWNQRRVDKKAREIAISHLKNLADAMLKGAKSRRVPVSRVVSERAISGGTPGVNYYFLGKAWNLLRDPAVKPKRTLSEIIRVITQRLTADETPTAASDEVRQLVEQQVSSVADFLQNQTLDFLKKAPRRNEFRTAFDAWRFFTSSKSGKDTRRSVSAYRRRAKVQNDQSDLRFLFPERAAWFIYSEIDDWLSLPTCTPSRKNAHKVD